MSGAAFLFLSVFRKVLQLNGIVDTNPIADIYLLYNIGEQKGTG